MHTLSCATRLLTVATLVAVVCCGLVSSGLSEDAPANEMRTALKTAFDAGNFRDAYAGYAKLVLDQDTDPRQVGKDLTMAVNSLHRLGRAHEIDALLDQAVDLHGNNWRLLQAAAQTYSSIPNYGYLVAGEFRRGNRRGGGQLVNAAHRDRTRALQRFVQAMPLMENDASPAEAASFYQSLANQLLRHATHGEAWRLQVLTGLDELPDYVPGWYYGHGNRGAPVDEDGTPVYYTVPDGFQNAANDGQRWRWALSQVIKHQPSQLNAVRRQLADFFQQQFGVQTMAYYGRHFGRQSEDEDKSGTYALHTLGEDETIARLATGVKRFKLPDEFNFIKIYQQIVAEPQTGQVEHALESLAQTFENRRQYPKAADYWRHAIDKFGPGEEQQRQRRLEQIVGAWGRFEGLMTQPAGQGATVDFRFRNGEQVHFEARAIDVEKLLADVKAYLKSNPGQIDWNKLRISNLGYRLVRQKQGQYVGRQVASWDLELKPRSEHFDRRVTVTTPLQRSGAYLLTARMADGNTSQIVVWLSDTVIVKKPMQGKTFYFVADAVTGAAIPRANIELFGYRQQRTTAKKYTVDTLNYAELTDPRGQALVEIRENQDRYQWLATARTGSGRFAYLGFTNVWRGSGYDQQYQQTKVFSITDRPVYRPKDTVKFKFWVRHAQYDQAETSTFARQKFEVEIYNPKREKVFTHTYESDEYGGFEGEFPLAEDAVLGLYRLAIPNRGGGRFRVEEYKKPEYEVTVEAPKKPIQLGEKITATIKANYYFGAPVTEARVKYKVMRTAYQQTWYPRGDWDWFYGAGYWWYGYDYTWYPGFSRWGCQPPRGWWLGNSYQPPELVAEAETDIGPDGTVQVQIDTAVAKELHGDEDHRYEITAEVVDQSRRTIVGTGKVLAARQPFQVFVWVDRGYYRIGNTIKAEIKAHTLDHNPVKGQGTLELVKISYNQQRDPAETVVETWQLATDDQGQANQQITAAAAGQYRLRYRLTDDEDHTVEGGYVFSIFGGPFQAENYRFNDLELIPEKREYKPGEKLKLLINTDRIGSTVALFARPANGVYPPPKILRLASKSTITELDVVQKDMPNFFVEAFTISDGKLHSVTKEIVVPPEKRVLNVAVEPSKETYKPGQPAKMKLTLTDFFGEPFVGSTVLAVYDKSVEYISGGSNVGEIKAYFWKWRRRHHPRSETNLGHFSGNVVPPGKTGMSDLGVFGGTVADEAREDAEMAPGDAVGQSAPGMAVREPQRAPPAPAASAAPANGIAADKAKSEAGAPLVEPTIRKDFADTAFWAGSLTTDEDGTAEVALNMPESLTTWKVKAWAMGHGTKVGQGEVEVITRKDLIVRMQAPRFFVEKDEVVLSANVHNYLDTKKMVQVALELEGGTLEPMTESASAIEVEPDGEARVDWRVRVLREGEAVVRMKALSDEESDALEMSFPVYVHGMLKTESWAGALRPEDESGKIAVKVPAERRINDSRLELRWSPTLAGAMVDALPYLANYPYGCTEQTLNRFLPTVITQKVLLEMDLDLKEIQEKRTNLNAQEIGDGGQRAAGWQRYKRNPVFDEEEVARMVKDGVQRLTEMQLSDGGWGWFSGWGEHSYPHTTAVVVHGLQVAQQNDVALVPGVLEKGVEWLKRYQAEQVQRLKNAPAKKKPWKEHADNVDAMVYMVLVDAEVKQAEMLEFLYRDRTHLAVYGKAMFGLALHKQQEQEKLAMILENISQFLVQGDENQTAYFQLPGNSWWYWWGSENEAHAYYLKLLSRTDPKGVVASRLVKYLLNNRKHATYWNSTRDTSLCVEAMADYLRASGENNPDLTVEVWLDGRRHKEVKIDRENLFSFDNQLVLTGDAVETGMHQVEFRKRGTGPLYYNAYLTNFTLEDHITSAGLEIKVNRKYYKLNPVDKKADVSGARGQAVRQKVEKFQREELPNLATLQSGDLVEIELEIDSKNDYEYLLFEDRKAAGFEPVSVRSGYDGNALGAYVEFRDERVVFFVRRLARGKHSVSYRLRAEIPGRFSALPTVASAMYAPELKGNSEEIRLKIED